MVQADLASVLAISPDEMSSQEKEDFCELLTDYQLDSAVPPDKMLVLFEFTQQILRYKGDQVDSLLNELDNIGGSGEGNEELREELVKAKKQNEQLVEEVENKERAIEANNETIDKLNDTISQIEKERRDLQDELTQIRRERLKAVQDDSEQMAETVEQLKETLQVKNKHILQLLSDLEVTEKDNEKLRAKESKNRRELTEATAQLTKLSGENITLREETYNNSEKINMLEERNSALVTQVNDLVRERDAQDSKLDQLIDALETRVMKWQEILSHKDNELADLQSRLQELESCSQSQQLNNYSILTQSLTAQEEKIKQLEHELSHATKDLQESTSLIQEFKKKAEARDGADESEGNLEILREELEKSQAHNSLLEERLKDAELDAQQRAEEMTEMIIQLREYEEGRYGLKEAREEILDLKKQINIRNKQIERLVQQANELHLKLGDKIILSPGEMYAGEEEEDANPSPILDSQLLKNQLHQAQQTAINLSIQNYDLKAQVIKLTEEAGKSKLTNTKVDKVEEFIQTDLEDKTDDEKTTEETGEKSDSEKLQDVIHENESLRQGLHEILESIHKQDGTSMVNIESECLESLLEALDSRSVSGWYHPAMRLQATLNKLQGTNQALRQQIREARMRESFFQAELQGAMMRLEELEISNQNNAASEIVAEEEEKEKPVPPIPPPRKSTTINQQTSEEAEAEDVEEEDLPEDDITEGDVKKSSSTTSSLRSLKEMPAQEDPKVEEGHKNGKNGNHSKKSSRQGSPRTSYKATTADAEVQTYFQVEASSGKSSPNNSEAQKEEKGVGTNGSINKAEAELRARCEEIRNELNAIKSSTDESLRDFAMIQDKLTNEVENTLRRIQSRKSSRANTPSSNGEETLKLKTELEDLRYIVSRKDAELRTKDTELRTREAELRTKEAEMRAKDARLVEVQAQLEEERAEQDDSQVIALTTTVASLQNLITKKEEVITKYQKLIQENSDEYNKLMEQYKTLENHTKRLPSPKKEIGKLTDSRAITLLMEKWLGRVHALEGQVCNLAHQLSEANQDLEAVTSECQKWKAIAQRVDEKESGELQEVLEERKREIQDLRTAIDQIKLDYEMKTKERLRGESLKFRKKEDEYKTKLRGYESEIARMKQHSRNTTYKTPISSKKEYTLLEKIKSLEEELQQSKQKEQSSMQIRRDRCAEEVTKWEEKKKLQSTNERLRAELREKATHVEALEMQSARLKLIISRMERERIALQRRLKSSQDQLSKFLLNPSSRPGSKALEDLGRHIYDSGMEASPLGNTPRSRSSSVGSMTNDMCEPKSRGRSRQDLEKAVVALKKVIHKLRSENSSKLFNKDYVERLQKELKKAQESYLDQLDRTSVLEAKLKSAEAEISTLRENNFNEGGDEIREVLLLREQLNQKCELLSKVKILLQRAMIREKHLMDQIAAMQHYLPPERLEPLSEDP